MSTATAARPAPRSTWDRVKGYSPAVAYLPVLATLALFVGMFGAGGIRYEGFADPQVLLSLLLDNAFLIVLAVGMTFVILTGGIDLSVGSVVALSTMIAAKTLQMGWPPYLVDGARCSLAGTAARAPLMGLLIHYFDIQPFIATLAGLFLARGLTYLISVESIPITDDDVHRAGLHHGRPARRLLHRAGPRSSRWSTVAVAAYVLARTRFGRTVYAIGGNESSAMLMGLRVALTKVGVYVDQRLLRRARRPAVLLLHALGLQPARRRHGARRDRRGRHRRHPAHRRPRATSSARCSASWCSAPSRPSSPSTAP